MDLKIEIIMKNNVFNGGGVRECECFHIVLSHKGNG
jgi:hypothetical protein